MEEPQEPVETLHKKEFHNRKPAWERELIQEVERYGAAEGAHRERKRQKIYNRCLALLCDIIDNEPSTFEEDLDKKDWKDSMI